MRIRPTVHTPLALIALVLAGCNPAASGAEAPEVAAAAAESESSEPPMDIIGQLDVEPVRGPAGTEVSVRGSGLPPSTALSLRWGTVDCDWVLAGEQDEEYHGRMCEPREDPLDDVTTDAQGGFETSFTVPEDYGFAHDVLVVDGDEVIRNKALFTVEMEVDVQPASGPVGTPITIEVRGMGWQTLEDSRTILYDDRYVGFMSAVTTRGTARATIPATGGPGRHLIEIERGAYTFPYLNPEQSPRPDIPTFDATFTVTDGDPVLPAAIADQIPPVRPRGSLDAATGGATLTTDVAAGPVGTPFEVRGEGYTAGQTVALLWYRIVGNRVSGQGWDERSVELGTATVGDDGSLTFATEVPGDVGGPHRIEAVVGDEVLAETQVAVLPAADAIAESVAWGEDLAIHLTGVGWTETANIYTLVYDNAYVGYACGFNTQGDVLIHLRATGEPGWHFVDLYPAIYKGEETRGRNNFRIPQLTAVEDHPGEDLPVFRFAFRIDG
jgi:hypothetical protein